MQTPQILTIQPQDNKKLLVRFSNGIEKVYDCGSIIHLDIFCLLQNEAFFRAVRVDPGGYGVSWNDDIDLSEYELWTNGVEVASGPHAGNPPLL